MTVSIRIIPTYPRWAKPYLALMVALAQAGIGVDEDAAVDRVTKATKWEAVDAKGNRMLLDVWSTSA